MLVVAIYFNRRYPTRHSITRVLTKHYTGVYLGRDYGTHDRKNYQGEVIGINVKPAGRFWEVVHELAEALRRSEGLDAEVVDQGKNEIFFNELPDFTPTPPRTSEGATQRSRADLLWPIDTGAPTVTHVPNGSAVEEPSPMHVSDVPCDTSALEVTQVPERYVPPHRRNATVEPSTVHTSDVVCDTSALTATHVPHVPPRPRRRYVAIESLLASRPE